MTTTKPAPALKLGLPKGSLQDATLQLLARAGWRVTVSSRSYFPTIDDPELNCMLVRAQEMARYVETGALDAGITGRDWVLETGAEVQEMAELLYAKQSLAPVRWVLAVPDNDPAQSARDLQGKVIATEVVNLTKNIWRTRRGGAGGVLLGGDGGEGSATCRRHRGDHGDGIVAAGHRLRIIDTVLESSTRVHR